MITSYKESNTEEEFNKKHIKHDKLQKTPHLYLLAWITCLLCYPNVNDQIGLR